MYTVVYSVALSGLNGFLVGVEGDVQNGLPAFELVGLPASSLREAKERVRSALINSGYQWPRGRIVISLSPSDWRKNGTGLDLAIALTILSATQQIAPLSSHHIALGELALDGSLRGFRGLYTAAEFALQQSRQAVVIAPSSDEIQPLYSECDNLLPFNNLANVTGWLCDGNAQRHTTTRTLTVPTAPAHIPFTQQGVNEAFDLSDMIGQRVAKRALLIAAAGNHALLLCGPPGSGKSMLAERLNTLLPPLSQLEMSSLRQIYSVAGLPMQDHSLRPFRSPHHTVSTQGLLGGGAQPRPGEVSLAHHGVLFLDELPEFSRQALEGLRQPLEVGSITIARSSLSCTFPSRFLLIAAMNPCPCGYAGSHTHACKCDAQAIRRYQAKLSGPLLDRFDLSVWMESEYKISSPENESPSYGKILTSGDARERILQARLLRERHETDAKRRLDPSIIASLAPETRELYSRLVNQLHLNMRSAKRILSVAQTISYLDNRIEINPADLAEAVHMRALHPIENSFAEM
ncbi:YifB family Mg chelatase-like AAA ATPase [Ferroacidibacillus organovorans]|uniref:MCM C-terminal AAA(+) ATPase domain-containing protein n=1 Tax=Ferroacidibacillus organovorans TaxID=1765683 RepID=A0A101XQZ7_9BACL|nr:YifB family Mg chelatase-like AAA ATPase [Ferroacidibacillus organovorans]KUO95924.1 hypothetical protein ATW55_09380 [Ferroacidibacillus organovorans]